MESINQFSGGMSSDLSKLIQSKDSYLQALNFRPMGELGSSNGSLVNIKGNECKLTFPDLQPILKLKLIPGTTPNSVNNITITINGITSSSFLITNNTLGIDIYNFIITQFPNCYQYLGNTISTKTFSIAYYSDYIILSQQPDYLDCSSIASIPTTITTSYSGSTGGTLPIIKFFNNDSSLTLTQGVNPYVKGITSENIIPIGSTFILNETYIFTAPKDSTYGPAGIQNELPYHDEFKGLGSIWKLVIDDITKQHTLSLIYSNQLDFTEFHPIPPSACSGRYESSEIKRIYWSDNYNKIRTINVALPQLMALSPFQISVNPKVEFTQGILDHISTGVLDAGCYQFGYRLSKVLGSVTNFSELSNPVYLTTNGELDYFPDQQGSLGTTTKSITWKLNNLDLNYDQIEFIVTYRNSDSAVPTITSVGTRTLLKDMTFTYVDSTISTYTHITLEEFLLFNGTFTHAKTCDTKDNRLFWGNVRAPRKELETFDARAFRANDAGNIVLNNNTVSSNYQISNPLGANYAPGLPQTSDTINEYYDSSGNYSNKACYLKPSTATTTKILGGEGVNISYEFATFSILTDSNFPLSSTANYDVGTVPTGIANPFRTTGVDNSIITLTEYSYPQNGKYTALKNPEKTSLLKGFQHEEIYRFGIQLFDKQFNPYFTKWIGDIKMPSYGDHNNNPDATAIANGISDFRLSFSNGPYQYMQVLAIKFSVNVSTITDLIGGYQIVRVKRTGTNKTIYGAGMLNPFISNGSNAILPASWNTKINSFSRPASYTSNERYYSPYPDQWTVETLNSYGDDLSSTVGRYKTFDCWDFDSGLTPGFTAGDKILVRSVATCVNYDNATGSYRSYFGTKGHDISGNPVPPNNQRINSGAYGTTPPTPFVTSSNNDSGPLEPFFIMKMLDNTLLSNYQSFLNPASTPDDYTVVRAQYLGGGQSTTLGTYTIKNYGEDVITPTVPLFPQTGNPCGGKQTLVVELASNLATTTVYGCTPNSSTFKKVLALYYKPNPLQYGGGTYDSRTLNEYIPCGEFIQTTRKDLNVNQNLTFLNFGGDVFTTVYDMMKTYKGAGSLYKAYEYNNSNVFVGVNDRYAKFSTSFFFPTTCMYNSELRLGYHPNHQLITDSGYGEDSYSYNTYCNAENDTKVYFPKPLNFQTSDEWINRIYFSEIKFNNEINDSWSVYLTNNFYDVEGNYGPINALISLKENMYYLQERGVGILMINPVSLITDTQGQPIKLGGGSATGAIIQKHYYKSIDAGTSHQWSVYRSQSAITFVDVRHKKIYLFNGEGVTPISDVKGQRNFTIKRLHNELLKYDNPIINKGIITTYDYYNNEFLYTFNNSKLLSTFPNIVYDTTNNENLTLAYSELTDSFSSLYSFTPNLYINNNKYLLSVEYKLYNTNNKTKLWFHNYGTYANFYGIQYPSTLKLLINDDPIRTKVFDNLTIVSEAIKDNVEWNDDLNIYPGSPTNPLYPDDINYKDSTFEAIRCYNQYQNTDWVTLDPTKGGNIRKVEQGFNLQLPRNKFDYDVNQPSIYSIFDSSKLTKTTFGERLRDKWLEIDLKYSNSTGLRFIIHNIKTLLRISDR